MRFRKVLESKGYVCNRGFFRSIRRALVKTGIAISIMTCISMSIVNNAKEKAIALTAEFQNEVQATQSDVDKYAEDTMNILTNSDCSTKEGVEQMVSDVKDRAETFANDNGTVFSKASVSRVVDGDTIIVDIYGDNCGHKDHEYKVRLIGVNTPESVASQEYLDKKGTTNSEEGKQASDYTKEILSEIDYVYLEADKEPTDKYGRNLYYVWFTVPENEYDIDVISSEMLNGLLVKEGYAEVATYKPNVKYADYFEEIEDNLELD